MAATTQVRLLVRSDNNRVLVAHVCECATCMQDLHEVWQCVVWPGARTRTDVNFYGPPPDRIVLWLGRRVVAATTQARLLVRSDSNCVLGSACV